MARAKSTPGGKTNANTTTNTSTNKEQTNTSAPASVPQVREEAQANVQAVPAETASTKPEVRGVAEPRKKFEVVKTEPRRVIPINLEDEIRRRAYELYQQRGAKPGSEGEDWLSAEREVRQRYHKQQSA
jgi:hypothetical protein